jgi:hypothetical protein
LVWKPEGKISLATPRLRWEDSIKMCLREIGLEVVDFIHLVQDRDWWRYPVNAIMNLLVP